MELLFEAVTDRISCHVTNWKKVRLPLKRIYGLLSGQSLGRYWVQIENSSESEQLYALESLRIEGLRIHRSRAMTILF